MQLVGKWLLIQSIVTTILYKLLRLVFISVQRIYWQLNGTAQKLRDARLPHNYQRSAHVQDVLMTHRFCDNPMITLNEFICTHNRFEDPQYIIDNDNITLLTIDEQDAVFCETKERDAHIWRSKYGSFMRFVQMTHCHRLIVVPLSTFHRLAEQIGDPSGELIFLTNTGRCGSTLITRIMECTGRCVAISEPNSPIVLARQYGHSGDSAALRELTRDVIRWECRPYQTMQPQPLGYFLKLSAPCANVLPVLKELFPSSRRMFMYREVVTVAKSLYRLSMVLPSTRLVFILGRQSPQLAKATLNFLGLISANRRVRLDNDLTYGVLMWAVTAAQYLQLRRAGDDIKAVRYEDLVTRPLDMCRLILEHCHFPLSLAEAAVKGLEADSQKNSVASKSVMGTLKEPEMTSEIKLKMNKLLETHGMPLIGEPGILEGTLGCDVQID